jgi:hypothetical protein
MDLWSDEARVAIRPEATYRRLVTAPEPTSLLRLLRRPAVVLLVISTLVPIMAVQRVTVGLVITTAVSWGFVVAIQWITGWLVVASAPARRVGFRRALDLWFAGHLPYSLWMLVFFSAMANMRSASVGLVALSAVVPSAWTTAIVAAYCRIVLGASPSEARSRAAVHLAFVWIVGVTYMVWAAGGTAGPLRTIREGLGVQR